MKPRILCLHGKCQSGAILSNKIAGARRKLARVYDLDFLDAPIVLPSSQSQSQSQSESSSSSSSSSETVEAQQQQQQQQQLAWWIRNEANENIKVQEALDYVLEYASGKTYHAILGFSQGGTLATALALSGRFPNIQAVVTAGSPFISEAYDVALQMMNHNNGKDDDTTNNNNNSSSSTSSSSIEEEAAAQRIPKLHFAGESDSMVPVESTRRLCDVGGNGELIVHEKGHLFPTKAVHTNYMMEFLGKHVVVVAAAADENAKEEPTMAD
jgi:predicted esterase